MKVRLISNINMDLLKKHLDVNCIAPYDQVIQELNKGTYAPSDIVFVHMDGEALLKENAYDISQKDELFPPFWEPRYFISALESSLKKNPDKLYIISSVVFSPYRLFPYMERNGEASYTYLEYNITRELEEVISTYKNATVLNMHHLLLKHGWDNLTDNTFWYEGKIRYNHKAFQEIAKVIRNIYYAYIGKVKKCLILDLDNTIWHGICGEGSVIISEEGIGGPYRDFQRILKGLKDSGILLVACSKNNEYDVYDVFEKNKEMILELTDFATMRLNWENKCDNIRSIAQELNIGMDSMVFIDDSEFERGLIQTYLPEVIVPAFPIGNIESLPEWFLGNVVEQYFPKLVITDNDRERTNQYHRNIERKKIWEKNENIESYIKSLNIKLSLCKNDQFTYQRISELSQRTNQFNLNGQKWEELQLHNLKDNFIVYALVYSDKFGNEGIVGGAIVELGTSKIHTRILDEFPVCIDEAAVHNMFISCRVLGRNVEENFWKLIEKDLQENHGINFLSGLYSNTSKNKIASDFLEYMRLQFECSIGLWMKKFN